MQTCPKLGVTNGNEYAELMIEGQYAKHLGAGYDSIYARNVIAREYPLIWDPETNSARTDMIDSTDWQDEFFRNAPVQNYHLALRGGNEKSTYALSAGIRNQQGIVINSYYKRYTFNINSDHKVKDWLRVGNILNVSQSERRGEGVESSA